MTMSRTRSAIEFVDIRELLNKENFNKVEFDLFGKPMTEILSKGVVRELGPNVSKDEPKKVRVQRCGMITEHF